MGKRPAVQWILLLVGALAQGAGACSLDEFGIREDSTLSPEQVCVLRDDLRWLQGREFSETGERFRWMFASSGEPEQAGRQAARWLTLRIHRLGRMDVQQALAANLGLAGQTDSRLPSAPLGSVVVTDAFFQASRPMRLGVLVHEARHSDGHYRLQSGTVDASHPDTAHGHCRTARIAALPAGSVSDNGCDRDLLGAYGYSMVFCFNVAQSCRNCSEEERAQARQCGRLEWQHIVDGPSLDPLPR